MSKNKKKDVIQEFKENPPMTDISFNATRLLNRRVSQFINATVKNRSEKIGKANAYRHLVRYVVEMQEKIEELETDLLKLMRANESVYFADGREKIIKKNDELILSYMNDSDIEWKKAYKQMEIENEHKEEYRSY